MGQASGSLLSEELINQILDAEIENPEQKGIPVGELFSDSVFVSIDGNDVSFHKSDQTMTVVDFWFKGCRGCAQEKYLMKKLIEKYQDDSRIRFVAVTPTSLNGIEKVKKKYGDYYNEIISVDGFRNCEKLFRFKSFPRHYFISKEGMVLAQFSGPIYPSSISEEYERRMLEFLKEQD